MEVDKPDTTVALFDVEDEKERSAPQPEAELNVEAPADKEERERNPDGTFKGEKPEAKEEKKPEKPEVKAEVKKTDETVPLAKYMDDKNKLRAELEARDLTIKQINEKLAAFEKANAPKPEAEPDFVEDPKGYVDHKLKGTLEALAKANETTTAEAKKAQEAAAQTAEQVQLQRFTSDLSKREAQFIEQNPDYLDALNHVREIRAFQLQKFEPGITQEQIIEVIRREELQLAVNLARAGQDPIATAFELAQRYGFKPKAKEEPKTDQKIAQLPEASRRLPPDQSLGGGHGDPNTEQEAELDPIDTALASLFRKRA